MYIEASAPNHMGDVARLISPLYQDSGAVCLNFWYHMYGDGVGSLNVFAQVRKKKYQNYLYLSTLVFMDFIIQQSLDITFDFNNM